MKAEFINKTNIESLKSAQNAKFAVDETKVLTTKGCLAFQCGNVSGLITKEANEALKNGKKDTIEIADIIYTENGDVCTMAYVKKTTFTATAEY